MPSQGWMLIYLAGAGLIAGAAALVGLGLKKLWAWILKKLGWKVIE